MDGTNFWVQACHSSTRKGQKVAAKGALIKNAPEDRLNVTSLQLAGELFVKLDQLPIVKRGPECK